MNEKYDAIVLGTGLTECVISGLLSVKRMRVLHMDRNNYYGASSSSLNLNQLYEILKPKTEAKKDLGASRDYNVDIVPKFVMASGSMVRIFAHTRVTRYLDFHLAEGSYVYRKKKVHKVPATAGEAAKSPLMGWFEKVRCQRFLSYVQAYDEATPATYRNHDLKTLTMRQLFQAFGLEDETREFLGHSVALHLNDGYLDQPALETVKRMQLYNESLERFGTSPYIYPLYGLGELPQAFARLSAVYGGTYMLDKKIEKLEFDANGVVCGVTSGGETAKCNLVVGDPSYFVECGKVRKTGQVVRCICILNHPLHGLPDSKALQVIIPQGQVGRKNDIYISVISSAFKVCPDGHYVAIVSSTVETADPVGELAAGMELLGDVEEMFVHVVDSYEPVADGTKDKCFISKSYDATTHFETTSDDVVNLYRRITGEELDWSKMPIVAPSEGEEEGGQGQ